MKLVTVPQKLFPNPKSNFTICEKNWQWLELVWQRYNCFSIFPIFHFSSRLPPSIDECLWKIARLTLYFCDYEDLTIPLWLNIIKTLPEAQRTQDIESKTWIISKSWNECKFQFSTFSLPPLPGNHLSHLVHLPVILLAHHHLNDNRYLPMFQQHILSPTWSQLTSTPAPIFRATPVPPPCRPPWWSPSPYWARPPSKWQPSTQNCPIGIIS